MSGALPGPAQAAAAVLAVAAAAAGETAALEPVAERIAVAIAGGGTVFALGAGHAQAFAMELVSRAGGLRGFAQMSLEDLRPGKRAAAVQLRDSLPERDPANGALILQHYSVTPADVVLIASNSGRNGAIVELALQCRRRGIYTAAFTSRAHSGAVASRHPSGRRLLEITDAVVDNHCPLGDATVEIDGVGRVCAASTVSFALLAQMLTAAVIGSLARRGLPVQPIVSANV
ncbi:MAG TPA: sugar isomerase domain-containing protein [Streptosporangiaceae bacterium]|jgi:uncharacterized phosphosugar-binding protein